MIFIRCTTLVVLTTLLEPCWCAVPSHRCRKVLSAIAEVELTVDGAEEFTLPVSEEWCPDYYKVMPDPTCFNAVRRRIRDRHINSEIDAARAVELCFSNCEEYNGPSSYYGGVAAACRRKFDELMAAETPAAAAAAVPSDDGPPTKRARAALPPDYYKPLEDLNATRYQLARDKRETDALDTLGHMEAALLSYASECGLVDYAGVDQSAKSPAPKLKGSIASFFKPIHSTSSTTNRAASASPSVSSVSTSASASKRPLPTAATAKATPPVHKKRRVSRNDKLGFDNADELALIGKLLKRGCTKQAAIAAKNLGVKLLSQDLDDRKEVSDQHTADQGLDVIRLIARSGDMLQVLKVRVRVPRPQYGPNPTPSLFGPHRFSHKYFYTLTCFGPYFYTLTCFGPKLRSFAHADAAAVCHLSHHPTCSYTNI